MSEPAGSVMQDAELHERCIRGDEAAWAEVWRFVVGICRWSRWRLGDRAGDLAASVLESLLDGGLQKVREPERFRHFLRRMTVNRILDELRRKRPDAASHDEWEREPVDNRSSRSSLEDEVMSRANVETVMVAIEELGGRCKELLHVYLSYKVGVLESYREIESRLGKMANVLSVEIRRCLERLRRVPQVMALAG